MLKESLVICTAQLAGGVLLKMLVFEVMLNLFLLIRDWDWQC